MEKLGHLDIFHILSLILFKTIHFHKLDYNLQATKVKISKCISLAVPSFPERMFPYSIHGLDNTNTPAIAQPPERSGSKVTVHIYGPVSHTFPLYPRASNVTEISMRIPAY